MRALGVIEADPFCDDPFGLEAVSQFMQVDRFVLERAPQPLDEDVVHAAAPSIHGDRDLRRFKNAGESEAGELAALIGVEDFRFAVVGQGFVQSFDAETGYPWCSTAAMRGRGGSPSP
jgi:hypothetical protein